MAINTLFCSILQELLRTERKKLRVHDVQQAVQRTERPVSTQEVPMWKQRATIYLSSCHMQLSGIPELYTD